MVLANEKNRKNFFVEFNIKNQLDIFNEWRTLKIQDEIILGYPVNETVSEFTNGIIAYYLSQNDLKTAKFYIDDIGKYNREGFITALCLNIVTKQMTLSVK